MSGTEPLIRLTVEAESEKESKSTMKRVEELARKIIERELASKQ
jgi:phosphomannomutase